MGPRGEEPILPLGSKSASQSFTGLEFLLQLLARLIRMVNLPPCVRLGPPLVPIRHWMRVDLTGRNHPDHLGGAIPLEIAALMSRNGTFQTTWRPADHILALLGTT